MRAVEDHHVDRPGVEAQQCVELTGTNSSIGLIALISHACSQREVAPLCVLYPDGRNAVKDLHWLLPLAEFAGKDGAYLTPLLAW
jgi:hypothetical protein